MNCSGDILDINCGRCGTPLKVRIATRTSSNAAKPPFNTRQVFVVFDQRRTELARCE